MTVALDDRPALRATMRARRRNLTPRDSANASVAIVRHLLRLPVFRRARRVAGFWPIDGEPDIREALLAAYVRGATPLLPVLSTREPGHMRFAPWRPGAPMLRNRYGIPEPAPVARRYCSGWHIDCVIAPLVAFDDRGHRLGLGGGYYDRAFAAMVSRERPWVGMIGVAYEHQRVDELDVAEWDVPLSCVVTDRRVYRCR
jgi:5-formyltetrahydrofolate cyclo-ligase